MAFNQLKAFNGLMAFNQLMALFAVTLLLAVSNTFAAVPNTNEPDSLAMGSELFQKKCSVCHGSEGSGGVGIPLNLDDFLATTSDKYLYKTIRLGRPGRIMPSFNELSDAQVHSLIRFIRSWKPEIKVSVYEQAPVNGDKEKGKQIFDSICINCHREAGVGGKGTGVTFSRPRDAEIIAPAIGNPAFLAAAPDQMIKGIIMTGRKSTPMMAATSMGLTETDVDNVVSYLRSLGNGVRLGHEHDFEPGAAVLSYESSYTLEETIANIKAAAIGYNFRYIREQTLDRGFVDKDQENKAQYLVYFCNFNFLNKVLSIDPRIGMFLPFRATIMKKDDTVLVMTVNPNYLCSLFNNAELREGCEFMSEKYQAMLEESTL